MKMAPREETLETARHLLAAWPLDRELVRPALAPTIPLHCSDEYLRVCRQLANEFEVGLHTHLAESKIQALSGIKRYGKTLTAHLDSLGVLGPDFTAAHAVWLKQNVCPACGWYLPVPHAVQTAALAAAEN